MLMFMWAKQYIKLLSENFSAVAATAASRRSRQSSPIRALTGQSLMLRPGSCFYILLYYLPTSHHYLPAHNDICHHLDRSTAKQQSRYLFHTLSPKLIFLKLFSTTSNHIPTIFTNFNHFIHFQLFPSTFVNFQPFTPIFI